MTSEATTVQPISASEAPPARNATAGISIMLVKDSTAYCVPTPATNGSGAGSST